MPYASRAQQRFFFAAEARGELPKGTAEEWAAHTDFSKLPERKKKVKKAALALAQVLVKQAQESRTMEKQAAVAAVNAVLEKCASHIPGHRQTSLRAMQASLAAGKPLHQAIKVAFPHLDAPRRIALARRIVKVASSVLTTEGKSYTGSPAGVPKTMTSPGRC